MNPRTKRRSIYAAVGTFLAVALVSSGVWLVVRDGDNGDAPATATSPSATPTATPDGVPATTDARTMTVTIYLHRGAQADPATVVPVHRTVPRSPKVATAALTALLAGPAKSEREAGYWSHFSAATAGMLRGVRIANGLAHADFKDFSRIIPNASSSAGSEALLAELDTTLKQFSSVKSIVYSFNSDVAAFYEWLQMSPPVGRPVGLAEARTTAEAFLAGVAGMKDLVYESAQWRSDFIATVDFRVRIGETDTPGPVTTVVLGTGTTSFTVLGAGTDTIVVDTPREAISPDYLPVVASPMAVAGKSVAYEGTVNITVVQTAADTVRRLGTGYVTGGADQMAPFRGKVRFNRPTARYGWALFMELSAHNGEISKLTAVRVRFAGMPAEPTILGMRLTARPHLADLDVEPPETIAHNGWVMPTSKGTITVTLRTTGTQQVRIYLTALGVSKATPRQIGTATRKPGGVFVYTWHYADEPLLAQFGIVATGPNGRADVAPFNVYHS
jgi:hypothetical protein